MKKSTLAVGTTALVAAAAVVLTSTPVGASVLDDILPKGNFQALTAGPIISPLTDAQVTTAKAIVGGDALLTRLIGSQQPTMYTVDTWTHLKDNGLIGAVVRITLPTKISFEEAVPTLAYDATEKRFPYYTSSLIRWRVQDASQIVVSIDLAASRIVGVHFISDADQTALDPVPTVDKPGDN